LTSDSINAYTCVHESNVLDRSGCGGDLGK
jgi:hypothetical protein